MPNKTKAELDADERFPWLPRLAPEADLILRVLYEKETQYEGSWAKRGGVGAFFVTCRKWDRIESIAARHGYDAFWMLDQNAGDVQDDVRDLIGYLLLWLAAAEARRAKEGPE